MLHPVKTHCLWVRTAYDVKLAANLSSNLRVENIVDGEGEKEMSSWGAHTLTHSSARSSYQYTIFRLEVDSRESSTPGVILSVFEQETRSSSSHRQSPMQIVTWPAVSYLTPGTP